MDAMEQIIGAYLRELEEEESRIDVACRAHCKVLYGIEPEFFWDWYEATSEVGCDEMPCRFGCPLMN